MPGATLKASVSPMDLGKELWESLGHLDDLIVGPSLTAEGNSTAASAHERFISNPTASVLYWNSKHTKDRISLKRSLPLGRRQVGNKRLELGVIKVTTSEQDKFR